MISTFIELMPSGLLQGLILSIVVMGVIIPFKLLNFADLTSEGSYPLGGAICASLIIYSGFSPLLALLSAAILAGLAGVGTALIHLKYKINSLLAGIILSTMAYSINLRLMQKPNISLFEYERLFSNLSNGLASHIIYLFIINIFIMILLYFFLHTEKGLALRAVGLNPKFAQKQGISLEKNIIFGLFIGNSLAGLGGALIVQIQGYADIGMGIGIVIHVLAAMMIGEQLIGMDSIKKIVISPICGAIIYQQIQGLALSCGLAPSDLKFLTGLIILIIMSLKKN